MPQQRAHERLQALPRACTKAERDSTSLSMAVAVRAAANAIAACLSTYASTALERAQAERVKANPSVAVVRVQKLSASNASRSIAAAIQPQPMPATNAVAECLSAAASTALERAHRLGESAPAQPLLSASNASPNLAATTRAAANAIAEANSGRNPVYSNILVTALNWITNGGVAR